MTFSCYLKVRRARLLQDKEGRMISKASEDSSYDVVKDVFVQASINEEGENECIKQSLNQDLTYY